MIDRRRESQPMSKTRRAGSKKRYAAVLPLSTYQAYHMIYDLPERCDLLHDSHTLSDHGATALRNDRSAAGLAGHLSSLSFWQISLSACRTGTDQSQRTVGDQASPGLDHAHTSIRPFATTSIRRWEKPRVSKRSGTTR